MSGRDLLGGLPRAVRRHRALLAAGLAAAAVATALPALAPRSPVAVSVLAAARELAPGVPLTSADLQRLDLPAAAVPAGALTAADQAVGQLVSGPVRRGEALTDVRLVGAGLVPRTGGLVAAPVRLADAAEAALLHTGDRVDVLATPTTATGPPVAVAVARGVQVLAVPGPGATGDGALVVVAADPAVAARLAGAPVSSRLSVTVLPP